ncbi:MAG: hypothetical protein ACKOWC_03985 [Limnohabitans sp.]
MATTLDERRQKTSQRPAAAMDLGSVDGAAPLNLTPPGTMKPDAPAPVPTQPAPQFTRTNAGPMLAQPPAAAPVAPAVDPQQQRMANQTAMYVQGAQAAAQPPSPVQQMVQAPMSAPVRNSINAAVANPQPTLGAAIDTSPRLFDPATARPSAAASLVSAANAAPAQPAVAAPAQPGEYSRQMGGVAQFFGDAVKTLVSAPGYGMSKDNPTAAPAIPPAPNYGNEGRRTPMPAAAPVAPGVIGPRSNLEAQAKNPASDQGQVPGAVKPMPQGAQPEVGPPGGYTSTRVDGVYRKGNTFTDEAGTRDTAFLNRGAITPQNQAAADQLAANYNTNQQALARLQAANPVAQQAAAPRAGMDLGRASRALTDLRSPEYIALRNAQVSGMPRSAYAALFKELTEGPRTMMTEQMKDEGATERAQLQDAGATSRTAMTEGGNMARAIMTNGLQQGELGLKREAQGFATRAAGRLEQAQAAYDNAKTDEERAAAAKRIRAIQGKGEDVPAKDRYLVTGGETRVVDGQTVKDPQRIFDTQTRQYVDGAGAAQPATSPAYKDGQRLRGPDGKTYIVKNGQPVLAQ